MSLFNNLQTYKTSLSNSICKLFQVHSQCLSTLFHKSFEWRNDTMHKIKARSGVYSLQSCSHWDETVIANNKIFFKQRQSSHHKPQEKFKKEIFRGESIIPPT